MAPQRKASKGVQRVVEQMTTARKRAPPRRKASKGVQQVGNSRKVGQRTSSATSPGASNFDAETIRSITREVTETIKAHVDDRLANILGYLQPIHQGAATDNLPPVASTSQQRTRGVANLSPAASTSQLGNLPPAASTSQLGNLSPAASTSQLGNHEVVNQAVDIATSALVGNTGLVASGGERFKDLPSRLLTDLPVNWRFNLLLDTVWNNLDDRELLRLKDFESGPGGIGRRLYEEIKTPRDFFRYLEGQLMLTRHNILHLQAMLWHLGRQDLLRKCVEYAKTETDTLYFYQPSPEPASGYTYALFHVEGKDLSQYKREGLEKLRTLVSNRLAVPPEFVFICGLEPSSSLLVTIMIPAFHADIFVELLKENSISELLELGIDSVHIKGETFNLHGLEDVEMVETTDQRNIVREYEKLKKTEALLEQKEIEVLHLTRELAATRKTLYDTRMAQHHTTQNGDIRTKLGDEISQILSDISNKLTDEDKKKLKSTFAWSSDEDALLNENGSHFLKMMVEKEIMRRQKPIDVGMYVILLLEGIKRDDFATVVRTKLTDLEEKQRGENRVNSRTLKQPMDNTSEGHFDEQPVLRRLNETTISIRKLDEKLDTLVNSKADSGVIVVDALEGYQRLKTSFAS